MEIANLIYHSSVIIISILIFFLKITAKNFELLYKALGKIVPLFCMMYASLQIFKILNLI
jgi:hypothetical protein